MATKTVKASAATLVVATSTEKVQMFVLGKLPRNGLKENTKHGLGGTAGTYVQVVAALKAAGPSGCTMAQLQSVCKANNDPGFARYAVRNHWVLPA